MHASKIISFLSIAAFASAAACPAVYQPEAVKAAEQPKAYPAPVKAAEQPKPYPAPAPVQPAQQPKPYPAPAPVSPATNNYPQPAPAPVRPSPAPRPAPQPAPRPAPRPTPPVQACGNGKVVSCCNQGAGANAGSGGLLGGILGGVLGSSCTLPILGQNCGGNPTFCCDSHQNGLINIGTICAPITL